MLADLLPTLAPLWPMLAAGLAGVLLMATLLLAWGRQRAWRRPVREYDREQRALAAFRRTLDDSAVGAAGRGRGE